MDIKRMGISLSKLMAESRKIHTISEAEEKVLYHLWNTSDIPQNVVYLLRNIPTIGAYVISRQIGNGTFTDFMIPSSLDVIRKVEEGNVAKVPEQYPAIPPFKDHRYYTLLPVHADDIPLYIMMIESPAPLPQIYVNFIEEYIAQAKRILEKVSYSYVIEMSKKAYDIISEKLLNYTEPLQLMETMLSIFMSDNIPLAIAIEGNQEKAQGSLVIKGNPFRFSFSPPETLWKYIIRFNGRKPFIIKRWDIPSYILSTLTNLPTVDRYRFYIENISYGLIGRINPKKNTFFIMGTFTNNKTVPFTETDAQTLQNSLSVLNMAIKQRELSQKAEHKKEFIKKVTSTFKNILSTRTSENLSTWNPIANIVRSFKNIKGLFVITKGVIIPVIEPNISINIEDIIYALTNKYAISISANTVASKFTIDQMMVVVIHNKDIDNVEKQAIAALFRNMATVKDYLDDANLHIATIKRLSMLLPAAMEKLGIEAPGHTQAMLNLARQLKDRLPINNIHLRMAIVFHDVGKLYINPEILLKRGTLTDEEWKVVRDHPIHSHEFVSSLGSMPPDVINAILYHHENFDGSGYPYGLIGEEIPLIARVIRVLDTFTTMTRSRLYKEGIPPKDVLEHLKEYSGVYYDPDVVKILKEIVEND